MLLLKCAIKTGLQKENVSSMARKKNVLCHRTMASQPSEPDPQEKMV